MSVQLTTRTLNEKGHEEETSMSSKYQTELQELF